MVLIVAQIHSPSPELFITSSYPPLLDLRGKIKNNRTAKNILPTSNNNENNSLLRIRNYKSNTYHEFWVKSNFLFII